MIFSWNEWNVEHIARHVVSPVRWEACARALRGAGAEVFLEAGPGDVLTKLARRTVPGASAFAVGSPEAARALEGTPADG